MLEDEPSQYGHHQIGQTTANAVPSAADAVGSAIFRTAHDKTAADLAAHCTADEQ